MTSCPSHSCRGRSRIRDCLVSSNSAAAKARWLSVLGQGGASGPTPLRPIAGSHEGNRRTEIRRADRTVCGWPRRPAKQGLVAISGSTERSTDGGHRPCGQGIRLSRRILPPPLFFECGSYPRRKGAVRCKAGELQVRARPRVDEPDQPAVVSATATRRHVPPRSRSERTSRRAVGGRRAADYWLSRAPHFSRLLPST